MANWHKMTDYVLKWEGGASSALADPAHVYPSLAQDIHHPKDPANPALGYYCFHTNKGVTWQTFEAYCLKSGIDPTTELFMQMPAEIWGGILKGRYWDVMLGDSINSQAIAELLVDFAWGSGTFYPAELLQQVLNRNFGKQLGVDGRIGNMTVAAVNQAAIGQERELFYDLMFARHDFLMNSFADGHHLWPLPPGGAGYCTGWGNRLNDFERRCIAANGWPLTNYDWRSSTLKG